MARLLPQRQFEKGTRTKQVRFWVREDEWARMLARALEGPASMSQLVVDSVLADDAKMTSADARALVQELIGARAELGRVALALRRVHGACDRELAEDALTTMRATNAALYAITERVRL